MYKDHLFRFKKYLLKQWSVTPVQAKIFLIFSLAFGPILIVVSAPFQSPDEPQHYWRAQTLSEGKILSKQYPNGRYGQPVRQDIMQFVTDNTTGLQPTSRPDKDQILKYFHKQNTDRMSDVYFENTAIYPPTSYIPQIISLKISNLLNLPLMIGFYAARFMNLLFYIVLVFMAISVIPFARWSLLLIGLLPMSIYQAASLSPDAIINGLSLFAVAYGLCLYGRKDLNSKHILIMTFALAIIALSKQAYVLMTFPFLCLLLAKIKELRLRLIVTATVALSVLSVTIIWSLLIRETAETIPIFLRPGVNISSIGQLGYISANPLGYINTMLVTFFFTSFNLLITSGMGIFGYLDIGIPPYCYYLIIGLLIISVFKDGADKLPIYVNRNFRLILILTSLGIGVLVMTLLYLGYTVVGFDRIEGLQGRYFIPAAIVLLPALITKRISLKIEKKQFIKLYCGIILIVFISSCFSLLDANYFRLLYRQG